MANYTPEVDKEPAIVKDAEEGEIDLKSFQKREVLEA
jgi:hypothetical protein